jgi:hypothetical protein
MKPQRASTALGQGRGTAPLPPALHPQDLTVYTKELTHRGPPIRIAQDYGFSTPTISQMRRKDWRPLTLTD